MLIEYRHEATRTLVHKVVLGKVKAKPQKRPQEVRKLVFIEANERNQFF